MMDETEAVVSDFATTHRTARPTLTRPRPDPRPGARAAPARQRPLPLCRRREALAARRHLRHVHCRSSPATTGTTRQGGRRLREDGGGRHQRHRLYTVAAAVAARRRAASRPVGRGRHPLGAAHHVPRPARPSRRRSATGCARACGAAPVTRRCSAFSIGNEIPRRDRPLARPPRGRAIPGALIDAVRDADPGALVTYVNYPTTEYLRVPWLDFESLQRLPRAITSASSRYVARLQNLAGDRPLVIAELGLDSRRNGRRRPGRAGRQRSCARPSPPAARARSSSPGPTSGTAAACRGRLGLRPDDARPRAKPALAAVRRRLRRGAVRRRPAVAADLGRRAAATTARATIGDCSRGARAAATTPTTRSSSSTTARPTPPPRSPRELRRRPHQHPEPRPERGAQRRARARDAARSSPTSTTTPTRPGLAALPRLGVHDHRPCRGRRAEPAAARRRRTAELRGARARRADPRPARPTPRPSTSRAATWRSARTRCGRSAASTRASGRPATTSTSAGGSRSAGGTIGFSRRRRWSGTTGAGLRARLPASSSAATATPRRCSSGSGQRGTIGSGTSPGPGQLYGHAALGRRRSPRSQHLRRQLGQRRRSSRSTSASSALAAAPLMPEWCLSIGGARVVGLARPARGAPLLVALAARAGDAPGARSSSACGRARRARVRSLAGAGARQSRSCLARLVMAQSLYRTAWPARWRTDAVPATRGAGVPRAPRPSGSRSGASAGTPWRRGCARSRSGSTPPAWPSGAAAIWTAGTSRSGRARSRARAARSARSRSTAAADRSSAGAIWPRVRLALVRRRRSPALSLSARSTPAPSLAGRGIGLAAGAAVAPRSPVDRRVEAIAIAQERAWSGEAPQRPPDVPATSRGPVPAAAASRRAPAPASLIAAVARACWPPWILVDSVLSDAPLGPSRCHRSHAARTTWARTRCSRSRSPGLLHHGARHGARRRRTTYVQHATRPEDGARLAQRHVPARPAPAPWPSTTPAHRPADVHRSTSQASAVGSITVVIPPLAAGAWSRWSGCSLIVFRSTRRWRCSRWPSCRSSTWRCATTPARPTAPRTCPKPRAQSLSIVQETLSMLRVIVAFGREDYEHGRFREHGEQTVDARVSVTVSQTLFALRDRCHDRRRYRAWCSAFGAYQVMHGTLTLGQLLVFIAYIASIYTPLRADLFTASGLQQQFITLRRPSRPARRLEPEIVDLPGRGRIGRARGNVRFDDVSLRLRRSLRGAPTMSRSRRRRATRPRSSVPPAPARARSLSLLPRLYDPQRARSAIDGDDVRDATVRSASRPVQRGPAGAAALLRHRSRENIAYGDLDGRRARGSSQAARAAGAHEFIDGPAATATTR